MVWGGFGVGSGVFGWFQTDLEVLRVGLGCLVGVRVGFWSAQVGVGWLPRVRKNKVGDKTSKLAGEKKQGSG